MAPLGDGFSESVTGHRVGNLILGNLGNLELPKKHLSLCKQKMKPGHNQGVVAEKSQGTSMGPSSPAQSPSRWQGVQGTLAEAGKKEPGAPQ